MPSQGSHYDDRAKDSTQEEIILELWDDNVLVDLQWHRNPEDNETCKHVVRCNDQTESKQHQRNARIVAVYISKTGSSSLLVVI